MEGLYLYCIKEKSEEHPTFSIKGIDRKGEVFTLIHRELEAIVSKVSLEEFGSGEIQKRSREDLGWIKEKALAHEKVIEEAMRNKDNVLSVIPMKFGTIFKEKTSLEKALNKDYAKIKQVLDKIRGKHEWSVKIYLKDRQKFEQAVKEKNEVIKEKEKEISSLPEGMGFFMEEELKEVISKEMDRELKNIVDITLESLKKKTADSIINKILAKELTGRSEPMVLNVAYLIAEEKIEDFKKEIEDLNQKMQAKGFCLEYSGPWSAYNFTSYKNYE